MHLSRRALILSGIAASGVRSLPALATRQKRVPVLVYDKALGAMRAIDRVFP